MATSALIVLDDEFPPVRVFGLDHVEFVARRIACDGIGHIVVVVDRVPRQLGEILDRLRQGGVRCSLARTTAELADLFHPDEVVLLLNDRVLCERPLLRDLAQADTGRLLCVGDAPIAPNASFERIDAQTWWTGLATIPGALVRSVAATPGDWDAASTLLRASVQRGIERQFVTTPALFDARDAASLARFEASEIKAYRHSSDGWGTRFVIEPGARLAARLAASRLVTVGTLARIVSPALALLAVIVALMSFEERAAVAAACVLGASLALGLERLASIVTAARVRKAWVEARVLGAAAGVTLLTLGLRADNTGTSLVVAATVVALTWLARRGVEALASPPAWWADITGQALLVAIATVVSPAFLIVALVAAACHAFACLAWLQRRVSELLTEDR